MLIASNVYFLTKSKNLITILNRFGMSVSYDQILRGRTGLALFALNRSGGRVPLPNHFTTHGYVTVSLDNFDFNEATISGLQSTHDNVVVLFQDTGEEQNNPTNTNGASDFIDKRARSFTELLPCQIIKDYAKRSSTVELPSDYTVNNCNRYLSCDKYING